MVDMRKLHAISVVFAVILLATACTPNAPQSVEKSPTPLPMAPTAIAPVTPLAQSSPTPLVAGTPTPSGCLPGEHAEMVWPRLTELQPPQAKAGSTVKVIGSGGYIRCGQGGYNESARNFQLYLDDKPIISLVCYVNHCENSFTIPVNTSAGTHVISVEGGSRIDLVVGSN